MRRSPLFARAITVRSSRNRTSDPAAGWVQPSAISSLRLLRHEASGRTGGFFQEGATRSLNLSSSVDELYLPRQGYLCCRCIRSVRQRRNTGGGVNHPVIIEWSESVVDVLPRLYAGCARSRWMLPEAGTRLGQAKATAVLGCREARSVCGLLADGGADGCQPGINRSFALYWTLSPGGALVGAEVNPSTGACSLMLPYENAPGVC